MESHVLIPKELCLRARPAAAASEANNNSIVVSRLLEAEISVAAASHIPKGTTFRPCQGTLRVARLDVFSSLKDHDPRKQNGAWEEMVSSDGRRVRRCTWVRFTRVAAVASEANVVCHSSKEASSADFTFEAVTDIFPDADISVDFGPPSTAMSSPKNDSAAPASSLIESLPLDLSLSLVSSCEPTSPEDVTSVDSGVSSAGEDNTAASSLEVEVAAAKATSGSKRSLPCSFCGKCFDRPSLLSRHLRTHTGERPHPCSVCGKAFSTSSSLNTHTRIHSGEKPHECPTCGKRFTASSNLYYHRMTHVKEKPHKCELCHKSFPTPGDLRSHTYVHSGSWPHRCHICQRGFSKATNLRNHLFLHTGEKPHECAKCGKRFALGCNMKAHMKTHNASSPTTTATTAARTSHQIKC